MFRTFARVALVSAILAYVVLDIAIRGAERARDMILD